jgi:hypothetical protein
LLRNLSVSLYISTTFVLNVILPSFVRLTIINPYYIIISRREATMKKILSLTLVLLPLVITKQRDADGCFGVGYLLVTKF